jgi:hypothetical protein
VPFGNVVLFVVRVVIPYRGQGVVDAKAANRVGGLSWDGKLSRDESCRSLGAGDDESIGRSKLHLQSVGYVVLNEFSRCDEFVCAVIWVGPWKAGP